MVGNRKVFFKTIGLDENLPTELEEGWTCGGGMEFYGGAKVSAGHGDE